MIMYQEEMSKLKLSEKEKKNLKNLYHSVGENKRDHTMKRLYKPLIATAACMALVLGAFYTKMPNGKSATKLNTGFTLMANAEELGSQPVAVGGVGESASIAETDGEENHISYMMDIDLSCRGENIESVTYSINEGAFEILSLTEDAGLLDCTEVEPINTPKRSLLPKDQYPDGVEKDCSKTVSQYTISYEKQKQENVAFTVIGEKSLSATTFENIFSIGETSEELEKAKVANQEAFGSIIITCKVNYKDGTTEEKRVKPVVTIENIGGPDGNTPMLMMNYQLID